MKKFLFLFLFLTSTTSLAAMDPNLAGDWKSEGPVYQFDDSIVFLHVTFKPTSVALTARCVYDDGQVLSARVETKAEYFIGSIKTLESKDKVAKDGDRECPIFTRPTEIEYRFKNESSLTVDYKELNLVVNLIRK